jgi:hypothetical protein
MDKLSSMMESLLALESNIVITIGDIEVKYDAEMWDITYRDEPPISFYSLEHAIKNIMAYKKRKDDKPVKYCEDCRNLATWEIEGINTVIDTVILVCNAHLISNIGDRSIVKRIRGKE